MVEEYICLEISPGIEGSSSLYGLLALFPIAGAEELEHAVRVYIPMETWREIQSTVTQLLNCYGFAFQVVSHTEVQDWYRIWLEQLHPVWLTEDTIVHPFPEPPQPELYGTARDILHIVPGTAFGTGHHATTRLAARLLLRYLCPSTEWLDAGTGSGILAILAARRGADHVYAVDNNPGALEQARFNIVQNGVAERITVILADLEQAELPRVDGIVANLHAELLTRLSHRFLQVLRDGGVCVVSGILSSLASHVMEAFQDAGFYYETSLCEDEWISFAFRKW